ncbi:MAG: 50S ribosomal protein L21 [Terriglobales bacterium]
MYAVIRTGGKQYRVSPGDVIRIERRPATDGQVEFSDVLAVSAAEGQIARPQGGARVVGSVVEEGRAEKILVFHFKRKKQYKRLRGHRQPFTKVRITEIAFDGQKFAAPNLPEKKIKAPKAKPAPEVHAGEAEHMAAAKHEKKTEHKAAPKKEAAGKKAAAHKPEAKAKHKAAPAKHADKKKKK